MRIFLFSAIALINFINLPAQSDTLVSYECRSRQIKMVITPIPGFIKNADNTDWNKGLSNEIQLLNTNPPIETYPNSGFTYIKKAHPQFTPNKYPVSAIVNIKRFENDSLKNWCTGTMISSNIVLTCAHGIWINNKEFIDSVLVAPGYNDEKSNPNYGTAISRKFYIPYAWYKNYGWKDIAIIELDKPIGVHSGWLGMSFNNDRHYFDNRVLHKFSYPGNDYYYYPNYSGDTLYYNYGIIDVYSIGNDFGFGYRYSSFLGQSGSSIFFTDNESWLIYGTQSISSDSPPIGPITLHHPIQNNIYYSFKKIIELTKSDSYLYPAQIPNKHLLEQNFPNPFNPETVISYQITAVSHVTLKVYDVLGKELKTLVNEVKQPGFYNSTFSPTSGGQALYSSLSSGVYFYKLQADPLTGSGKSYIDVKKMILLK